MTGFDLRKFLTLTAFGAITLAPLALLVAGGIDAGGRGWLWLASALAYMAGMLTLIDQMTPQLARLHAKAPAIAAAEATAETRAQPPAPPSAQATAQARPAVQSSARPDRQAAEFPAGTPLLCLIAIAALGLLGLCAWAIARHDLTTGQKLALGMAAGLWLGQVAHPCAHELIHRPQRGLFRLGVVLYAAMLFGHHASAHRLVHHRHVATPDDPYSAKAGLGFWRFALRAWRQGYRAGKAAEDALHARTNRLTQSRGRRLHPYHRYALISLCALGSGYALGGGIGLVAWCAIAAHAQIQQLLADYVQHYGLRRARLADGRYEAVGPRHSWNNPHWLSSRLMLHAPRHSDHHSHPTRPYPALELEDGAPLLPWPLPLACCLALVPPLWHRLMAPRLARLAEGGR